ncbi:Gfo/Idh/MocA family protein [Parapedobacter sp. 10938]|uniref:Gfo/Idh/MocA family protein n=1 Tax=Parapedobacter flavus TaxID=3110225 RepID=UPI002DB5C499|nr:Gfo/Idh/MocA family oxidoreductase [Parapedobacter sp. 10938]MEC3880438.1 Gfo/Idh/MocA family oxidoreductase [Parapedobacter sp. 10938]
MMMKSNRRAFIKTAALSGVGLTMGGLDVFGRSTPMRHATGKRVGIIGLDTSHSVAFTKALNAATPDAKLNGYKVIAAYPYGSRTIESSAKRIPGYVDDVKKYGVSIVESIDALLAQVDVVLLETNDGRLHLEQALPVIKAGKRLFIDKPIAASLEDAQAIFKAAEAHDVPVFSSSSLRYTDNIAAIRSGELIGKVTGADTYSPAVIEPTHPDLFWYGIHGVEMLYAVMGTGCVSVSRTHNEGTDIVVGTWNDGRIGTFRGTRTGHRGYGGIVHGEKGHVPIAKHQGYTSLLYQIVEFFETGVSPVDATETLEIFAFMAAADESKRQGGKAVKLKQVD